MNAEIDELLNQASELTVGLMALLRSSNLDDSREALQEVARSLDVRIGKIMELNAETDEAEQTPKLPPLPWAAYDPGDET